jgi:uncharacterized membrane protein
MRVASVGHAAFAVTMIGLGIIGLVQANLAPIWDPLPDGVPARAALVYLCAIISVVSGVGLLFRRTATPAARLLFATLLFWFLVFRLPWIALTPGVDSAWSASSTAVMLAGAWVLYSWFATDWDKQRLGFVAGAKGLRVARVLYGLGVIFFGVAHFIYLQHTAELVPGWLPGHLFWARFTGCTFIAAGLAIVIGVFARLSAALSALEIGLFLLLVWVPIVAAGSKDAFQWSETIESWALLAGAWVAADSYRNVPWRAVRTAA